MKPTVEQLNRSKRKMTPQQNQPKPRTEDDVIEDFVLKSLTTKDLNNLVEGLTYLPHRQMFGTMQKVQQQVNDYNMALALAAKQAQEAAEKAKQEEAPAVEVVNEGATKH